MSRQKKDSNHRVVFYEGYKQRESPRAVIMGNKELKIQKIIWRKRMRDQKSGNTLEVFKCKIGDRQAKVTMHESGRAEVTFEEE
jgi:hypothetical protein